MSQEKRQKTTFAMTQRADELLAAIAEHHGISRTSVLEMIVRQYARELGLGE